MIEAVEHIAGMAPYTLADKGAPDSISLAENESAFPPSELAISAAVGAASAAQNYPDPDWTEIRNAIAEVHNIPSSGILCGAGSMELIGASVRAFCGPHDEVIGSEFGYLFVMTAVAQVNARFVQAPEENFHVSVDALLDRVTPATKLVFVCNPGNPTGTRIHNAEVCRLRMELPGDVLLVVDQAYAEFDDQEHQSVFDLVVAGRTVITRTFSKAYGLAGARVGWGYFPPDIAREVKKLLNPNNISGVSQTMAAAAMRDQDWMKQVVTKTAAWRDDFRQRLSDAGYFIPRSHSNFVLIQFATVDEAQLADRELRSEGLILRSMGGYGLPNCLRATIGDQAAMDRAAGVLITLKGAKS